MRLVGQCTLAALRESLWALIRPLLTHFLGVVMKVGTC